MDNNIYSNPEKFNLEIIDVLDASEPYYFNYFIVWKDKENRLYYGQDDGCSCPVPFDGVGLDDIVEIKKETWEEFEREVHNFNVSSEERISLLDKVKRILKKKI